VRGYIAGRGHELAMLRRQRIERVFVQRLRTSEVMRLQPVLVERHQAVIAADAAETVHVAVADARPVEELDAELEGALGLLDELDLVDFQDLVEQLQVRHRGFADADRADLFRFHQADRIAALQHLAKGGGGHPAGGAATDDHDVAYARFVAHAFPAICIAARKKDGGPGCFAKPAGPHLKLFTTSARTPTRSRAWTS